MVVAIVVVVVVMVVAIVVLVVVVVVVIVAEVATAIVVVVLVTITFLSENKTIITHFDVDGFSSFGDFLLIFFLPQPLPDGYTTEDSEDISAPVPRTHN